MIPSTARWLMLCLKAQKLKRPAGLPVGAISVTKFGTRTGMPTKEEVEGFLSTHDLRDTKERNVE